jgi:hypothetical protein
MMQLSEFGGLIENMPVSHQSFTSKRTTWTSRLKGENSACNALRLIFGTKDEVTLSRCDLRSLGRKTDLTEFVMATLIWGYPGGMRGNHIPNMVNHISPLTDLLEEGRTRPVTQWNEHFARVKPITGIGLSTYTKFLNFLSVKIDAYTSLILDDRIVRVARARIFEELMPLAALTDHVKVRDYPRYLECMHRIANGMAVPAESIEFFLFEFGLNLKATS